MIDGQVLKKENARVCGKRKSTSSGGAAQTVRQISGYGEGVTGKEWWRKWSRGG